MAMFVVSCFCKGEVVDEVTVDTQQLGLKETDVMLLPVVPVQGTTMLLLSFKEISAPMISIVIPIGAENGKAEG